MERLALIFGMMSTEHKEEEKEQPEQTADSFADLADDTTNNNNNDTTTNNDINNKVVRAGDRLITFKQLAGFIDVVVRMGWAFTEFSFITRHVIPVVSPVERPRRIAGIYYSILLLLLFIFVFHNCGA